MNTLFGADVHNEEEMQARGKPSPNPNPNPNPSPNPSPNPNLQGKAAQFEEVKGKPVLNGEEF